MFFSVKVTFLQISDYARVASNIYALKAVTLGLPKKMPRERLEVAETLTIISGGL